MTPLLSELADTHAACFAATRAWSEAEFRSLLNQDTIRFFGDGRSFVMVRRVLDEAEILTLATHPDHRRQGLAKALLASCEADLCPDVQTIFLDVDTANTAACALYRASGYAEVGRRVGYYALADGNRSDALVLSKNLV